MSNSYAGESSIGREFLNQAIDLLDQSMFKIRNCLGQLNDQQIWWRPGESLNSVGNLLLHLCGNLHQWTVVGIGGFPDQRDRESEFAQRDVVEKKQLLDKIENTVGEAKQFFVDFDSQKLTSHYTVQGFEVTALGAINHTVSHFVGHTHQIIYVTRLILGDDYKYHWSPKLPRDNVPI